ncbi:MAG: SDR family oxidoreductase [Pseudomonadota bacterium]
MNMNNLAGKNALVTGGSRGIGAAIVKRLASQGAHVTLTYAGGEAAAQAVVEEVHLAGGYAQALKADAGKRGDGENAVAKVVEDHGSLDILVSNAGVNISKPMAELSDEDFDTTFGINVHGNFEVIRSAAKEMKEGGRIVVISATIANSFFAPGLALYGASKAAVNAFVQGWARDLGPRGITINAVVPGPIDTDMNPKDTELGAHLTQMVPLGRYGHSEEVAALATFLVGEEAGFITGARMIIDGGMNV